MLFLITFFIFNFSYLFSVMFLVFLVMYMMMFVVNFIVYLKFLVMLVYISGVVVFILYISCLCWNYSFSFSKIFLFGVCFVYFFFSYGMVSKFSDVGEYLWMFLFFAYLFNVLVSSYSLNLFKSAGSLRF